jgi:hypothetical protein
LPYVDVPTAVRLSRSRVLRADGVFGSTGHLSGSAFKIMSVICPRTRRGTAGYRVTREATNPNGYWEVVTSGDTSEHEI